MVAGPTWRLTSLLKHLNYGVDICLLKDLGSNQDRTEVNSDNAKVLSLTDQCTFPICINGQYTKGGQGFPVLVASFLLKLAASLVLLDAVLDPHSLFFNVLYILRSQLYMGTAHEK